MDELLNFLQHTYKKYAGMERDKKSIVLEISRDDLQMLIQAIKDMDEIPVWKNKVFSLQDEINQLKQQHAEKIEKSQQQLEIKCGAFEHLAKIVKEDACEFKGYRQAVKDILGGEGRGDANKRVYSLSYFL